VVASLPFAPEIVLPAIDYYINQVKLTELNPYGFKATFNPTYPGNPAIPMAGYHHGITGLIKGRSFDDRKLSYRLIVAIDAKLPLHRQRLAAGGFGGVGYDLYRR
jgi:hypothetical protein